MAASSLVKSMTSTASTPSEASAEMRSSTLSSSSWAAPAPTTRDGSGEKVTATEASPRSRASSLMAPTSSRCPACTPSKAPMAQLQPSSGEAASERPASENGSSVANSPRRTGSQPAGMPLGMELRMPRSSRPLSGRSQAGPRGSTSPVIGRPRSHRPGSSCRTRGERPRDARCRGGTPRARGSPGRPHREGKGRNGRARAFCRRRRRRPPPR